MQFAHTPEDREVFGPEGAYILGERVVVGSFAVFVWLLSGAFGVFGCGGVGIGEGMADNFGDLFFHFGDLVGSHSGESVIEVSAELGAQVREGFSGVCGHTGVKGAVVCELEEEHCALGGVLEVVGGVDPLLEGSGEIVVSHSVVRMVFGCLWRRRKRGCIPRG